MSRVVRRIIGAIIFLFGICTPGSSQNNFSNVISISGGFPELLDIEYQRSFDRFYVAVKPGIVVMLLWNYNNHSWPAYPALRCGYDLFRIRSFGIGPQLEAGYIYVPEKSLMMSDNYSESFKDDYLYFTLSPAVRYSWRHLELQLSAGLAIETLIRFADITRNGVASKETTIQPSVFKPAARFSAGFAF
jgi:hypothetical protein